MSMDLTPGPEVYEAARSAMQQREAVPGRPECGPYPATLDELAESIVDAIWPLAYRAGREDAAAADLGKAWGTADAQVEQQYREPGEVAFGFDQMEAR